MKFIPKSLSKRTFFLNKVITMTIFNCKIAEFYFNWGSYYKSEQIYYKSGQLLQIGAQ